MSVKKSTIKIIVLVYFIFTYLITYSQIRDGIKGNNFLPLQVGNQWQFIEWAIDFSAAEYYSLSYLGVEKDTLIQGEKFYWYDNDWVRYCNTTNIIYIHWNDTDRVFMNFNLAPDDTFQQFTFSNHIFRESVIVDGNRIMFGNNIYLKGYFNLDPPNLVATNEYFAENLGPFSFSLSTIIGSAGWRRTLIMAIHYDSAGMPIFYSEHYKPEFSIDPISIVSTPIFTMEFDVNHEYSVFFPPTYPFQGINFIDSVYMFSYYSNGDSVINIPSLLAFNNTSYANSKYIIDITLDTLLLKNGYNFYYRFLAKDKGIIPEYTWSPDSGYYECVWDDPVGINESPELYGYNLYQNYPNPFNPITTIQYSIGKDGMVEVEILDILGRKLRTLIKGFKNKGNHQVTFDASEYSSGIYYYKLETETFVDVKKMMLLK